MIRFLPDEYYSSTYKIDFKKYYDMGYRGILFDIDNTLVRHNEPATSRAIQLMEQLKAMGFKVCLVSNNKEPRVAAFNKKMKVNYIFKAGKPSKKGYIRAMNEIGCNINNTIAVNDQIYTDIIGSASLGIHTILVKPIDTSHEEIQITLKRIIEKPFIFYFRKKHGMVRLILFFNTQHKRPYSHICLICEYSLLLNISVTYTFCHDVTHLCDPQNVC